MSTRALPDGCAVLMRVDSEKLKSLETTKQIYDSPTWESWSGEFSVIGFDPGRGDESVGFIWRFRADDSIEVVQVD